MFFDRSKFLIASLVILFFFVIVFGRLTYLQLMKGGEYAEFSDSYTLKEIPIRAPRGNIYDRRGNLLASTRPSFNLFLTLKKVSNLNLLLEQIAPFLNSSVSELQERIAASRSFSRFSPVPLANDLSREMVSQIQMKKNLLQEDPQANDWDALEILIEPERHYLEGEAFGHVLGYLREISDEKLKQFQKEFPGRYAVGDWIGAQGIERRYDLELRGKDGKNEVIVDALGREVKSKSFALEKSLLQNSPEAGSNLHLTIDKDLQKTAYQALNNKEGAVVVMNVQSGEVLALVSQPSYDPEKLLGNQNKSYWAFLNTDERKSLLNRTIQAAYPPGSTFKIMTGLSILAESLIRPEDKISCPGYYEFGGRKFGCWLSKGHGPVDFYRSLVQSCDVYFYKMGERLGIDRLASYAKLFGLGSPTGIELDFEKSGLVPDSVWKMKTKKEEWNPGETLSVSIGQGYNLVTPLQNALMMARVANDGLAITPTLIQAIESPEGVKKKPERMIVQKIDIALDHHGWAALKKALWGVVQDGGGTAHKIRLPGLSIAGKTGTAQVVNYDTFGRKARSKKMEDHAWFVAYAPADKPEIAVSVIVEHGGHGGAAAAPVAQAVIKKYFEIYHDYGKRKVETNPKK